MADLQLFRDDIKAVEVESGEDGTKLVLFCPWKLNSMSRVF
jgi:hypothetical protein